MVPNSENRWKEIRSIHAENQPFFQLLGSLLMIGFGIFLGTYLFSSDSGYITNLYSEFLSIAITVLILDLLARLREDRRFKEQLIREMSSRDNSTALRASEAIAAREWLVDGSLKGVFLSYASLKNANLEKAVMPHANLYCADLRNVVAYHAKMQGARMAGVNMQGSTWNVSDFTNAHLNDADLRGARFRSANLQNVFMMESDLQRTDLDSANLKGADLSNVNLEGAKLENVQMDEETVLPDCVSWSPDTDLRRFTDPDHEEFWRPEDDSWLWIDDDSSAPWWFRGQQKQIIS